MTGAACRRCGNAVELPQTVYCSGACRRAVKRRRNQRNARAKNSPAHKRRQKAEARRRWDEPFPKFSRAAKHQVPVGESAEQQEQARAMVANGAIAYENRDGLIRNVGFPRKLEKAGRVYSRAVQLEARSA